MSKSSKAAVEIEAILKDKPASAAAVRFAFEQALLDAAEKKLKKKATEALCIEYVHSAVAPMGRNARKALDKAADKTEDEAFAKLLEKLAPQYEAKSTGARRGERNVANTVGNGTRLSINLRTWNIDGKEDFPEGTFDKGAKWEMKSAVVDGVQVMILTPRA